MASNPTAVFDVINDRIIKMLDEGIIPWKKPWAGSSNAPRNLDGRPYSGINAFFLHLAGYSDPRFLTYKKAVELGGMVRKGEKGWPVVFWKQLNIKERQDDGTEKTKRVPLLRYFTVFNVEQCDGLDIKPLVLSAPTEGDHEADAAIAAIVAGMPNPPTISHDGGDRAYYIPASDGIHLPKVGAFISGPAYADTLFHELGHSTGHKSRLNREGIEGFDHFGSDKYAREELVAEFASAFLMAEAGLSTEDTESNTASYIASWRTRIKEDPKLLVVAAGRGQKAADYILGKVKEEEQEKAA
jgi:antirestriction protein ArdC